MIRALVLAAAILPHTLHAKDISGATYVEPTDAYGHGAVEGGEYAGLKITYDDATQNTIRFQGAVFEDTAPRLFDFDEDGTPEVVAVLSGFNVGAMVQVFDFDGEWARPVGQTAAIGRRHRWLAIAGIADFDGDGFADIAYVDRPHLAKTLRIVSVDLKGGEAKFTPIGSVEGVTNHALGAPEIEGGVRLCAGEPPVIITANANWSQVVETVWNGRMFETSDVGPYRNADSFAPFLSCN